MQSVRGLENVFFCLLVSPQRSNGEGTVHLDGEGYAAVGRPTRWNPNVSTVAFKFRTFSSEALLMYLATEDMVRAQPVIESPSLFSVEGYRIQNVSASPPNALALPSAEGLHVPGALRGQGEGQF